MNTAPFTVVLCEGYHDRSFLAGALVGALGWEEPALDKKGRRQAHRDRWGDVGGGDFGYRHRSTGAELRLRPCHGHEKIRPQVEAVFKRGNEFDRLVINYDGDKGGDGGDFLDRIHQSVEDTLRRCNEEPRSKADGHWQIRDGTREVQVLVWHCDDAEADGVPAQQCLERIICASAASIWPERAKSLGAWLANRPDPTVSIGAAEDGSVNTATIAKSYSWALMAGWFADHGCDDFLRQIWSHPSLSAELRRRLEASNAWSILDGCASPPRSEMNGILER